ncbi:MAG: extracellular catalytic domain type 2 short-chain-length polyhydroxyalkanoate depolymerase [Betaproteobacteria bacterium]
MRFLLLAVCLPALAAEPLPALRADLRQVTASGLSSGGYMAVQLHVAHSATVKGVGVIAGGPYYCAHGSLWTAYHNCMTPGLWSPLPDAKLLKDETDRLAKAKRIDPTANLAAARVWIFHGMRDRTVYPAVVQGLREYYGFYKVKAELVDHKPAGHAMVTEDAGNMDCAATRDPYINDCDYDAAGELLKHILGSLKNPASKASGRLLAFDQQPYAAGARMGDSGFLYVPKACEKGRCRVHVAFHGCRQSAGEVGERFAREAGYNRWADTNRLLVLYPQAAASWSFFAFNPRACWDWWGYTDQAYHTQEGAQIKAVMSMLKRLAAAPN